MPSKLHYRTSARPSLEQLLDEQICALDRVIGEVRLGLRGPSHFDELEQRAHTIAAGLRKAFRTGSVG